MLGRHGKNLRSAGLVAIAALKQLDLVQDLLGVLHELPAIFGQANPFFAPDQDGDPHFFFQLLDGTGQGGLGDEKFFGCLGHVAEGDDFLQIEQLLDAHG